MISDLERQLLAGMLVPNAQERYQADEVINRAIGRIDPRHGWPMDRLIRQIVEPLRGEIAQLIAERNQLKERLERVLAG